MLVSPIRNCGVGGPYANVFASQWNIDFNWSLCDKSISWIRNEERGSGTRNEDPERGTRIWNEERDSGTGHEIPYDLVQMV